MTKKDKVIKWVNQNYKGFEFNHIGGNGRYGTSWTFYNYESKDCIHIYNNAGTNVYKVAYYEDEIEYREVQIFTGYDENNNHLFRTEMRWERKGLWSSAKSKSVINIEL